MMQLLRHLENLVSGKLAIAKDLWMLFRLEMQLAGANLLPVLICLGAIIFLVITLGLILMALTGYFVFLLTGIPLVAIGVVLLLTLLLLFFVSKYFLHCLKQMSFAKTRSCLTRK